MPEPLSWSPLRRVRALDAELGAELGATLDQLSAAAAALIWAEAQIPAFLMASGPTAVLSVVVEHARALAGVRELWALTWTGDLGSGAVSISAFAGDEASVPAPQEISRTVVGEAIRSGRPLWVENAAADHRFDAAQSVRRGGLRAVGCVPIGTQGALYLHESEHAGHFPLEVQAGLTALCQLAVPFLRRFEEPARPRPQAALIPGMIGEAPAMLELYGTIRAFAPMPWPALILGETGTGKELVARALHQLSPRRDAPLVAVNCGAIPEDLAESTLFGHEKGAFTGADRRREGLLERVGRGTLFLDEVGELSARAQVKLLRVVQEGSYERVGGTREQRFEGRIVAATLRALDAPESERRRSEPMFRADLYHRLAACTIHVPPLRERVSDLPELADHLLKRAAEVVGIPALGLSAAAQHSLCSRPWPGNVRELDNVLRAALARALAADAKHLGVEHFGDSAPQVEGISGGLVAATQAFQRERVLQALQLTEGNRTRAAELLGVSRQWLHQLLGRDAL